MIRLVLYLIIINSKEYIFLLVISINGKYTLNKTVKNSSIYIQYEKQIRMRILIVCFLVRLIFSIKVKQDVNISPNPNINTTLPFKDGDIITFESVAYPGSYIRTETDDCKDKNEGDECGDYKGLYGSDETTRFIVKKLLDQDIYCFESANFPTAFMYVQYDKCNEGNTECGDVRNFIRKDSTCSEQVGYRLIPIDTEENEYVLQSATKSNVYIRMNIKECLNQASNPNDNPRPCGDSTGRWADSPTEFKDGDPEVLKINVQNAQP